MSASEKTGRSEPAKPATGRMRWWGGTVVDGEPPKRRWVIRWGRIGAALAVLCLIGYLSLATALWAYYTTYRKIPGVQWIDIAVLPRFGRVQAAIGAHYLTLAQRHWAAREYTAGLLTARAAVNKAPDNVEARLFLASCWQEAGMAEEGLRVLRDGLPRHAANPDYQRATVALCLSAGRYEELLKLLRQDLPARGAKVLETADPFFAVAEARAVLETTGAAEAETLLRNRAGLADDPLAVPLAARIEWELGRKEESLARLGAALVRAADNPAIHDAYVDTALKLGKTELARTASATYLKAFPDLGEAQLRYLEARGSRQDEDRVPWLTEVLRYLVRNRDNPLALQQLANLAALQGWTDVTYLLYEHTLQARQSGFPFVVLHVVGLLKSRQYAEADSVWRALGERSASQLGNFPQVSAMIDWGTGRRLEARQATQRLRDELVTDRRRLAAAADFFTRLGFSPLGEQLLHDPAPD